MRVAASGHLKPALRVRSVLGKTLDHLINAGDQVMRFFLIERLPIPMGMFFTRFRGRFHQT
jgi:hypothetical protein